MAPLWLQEESNYIIIMQKEYANEEYQRGFGQVQ